MEPLTGEWAAHSGAALVLGCTLSLSEGLTRRRAFCTLRLPGHCTQTFGGSIVEILSGDQLTVIVLFIKYSLFCNC